MRPIRSVSVFACRPLVLASALTLFAMAAPCRAQTPSAEPLAIKRFVVLHNQGQEAPFRLVFDQAIREALRVASPAPVDVYIESLDAFNFPKAAESALLVGYLKAKYAHRKIDAVIAMADGAVAFARSNRDVFGNAPVVAFVTSAPLDAGDDSVTGLRAEPMDGDMLGLALQLLPATQRVFVVDGALRRSDDFEADFRRSIERLDRPLQVVYLRDLPMVDLIARIEAIPDRSIVYFHNQAMWDGSTSIGLRDGLARVLQASPVPVFSFAGELIGMGSVGAYRWQIATDATRIARMAVQIANGVSPRHIPPARATMLPTLDWRQLRRWNIPEERIPSGSVVLFRPQSFFELYRRYVLGGLLIFSAQLALIASLLVQRVRRRHAEEQTRNGEDRYRSVVDTQSELICRFLPDSTLTFVNDAYCRFWEKTSEQLLGTKFTELIPPPVREAVLERIGRIRGRFDSHEHQVVLPDGTIGWHHWINHAIVDERGAVIELQGVGRDITDRKRAEEAIVQLEARNSALLRAIPDLMFVLLRDGTYVDYHARDPNLLFVPPEQFIGRTIRDVMPPALAEMFMNALEQACESQVPVVVEYELPLDETRHFEARLVSAEHDRVLSMVRDVTEARRAQALNRELAGRLIVSQEVERQRIARELHDDLSQKIALLNIEIDQLAGELDGTISRARLHELSLRAGEIATDVHNLSHELHPSKLQTLGLVAVIQSLSQDVSRQFGVEVAFNSDALPKSIDPNVSLCLYRIAQEALHNVAKHSRARQATVRLVRGGEDLFLQIADSGIGFDSREQYAGLGLVSMRERVALAKGQLAIHTHPGRGTRIDVRVPLASAAHESVAGPKSARVRRFEEAV